MRRLTQRCYPSARSWAWLSAYLYLISVVEGNDRQKSTGCSPNSSVNMLYHWTVCRTIRTNSTATCHLNYNIIVEHIYDFKRACLNNNIINCFIIFLKAALFDCFPFMTLKNQTVAKEIEIEIDSVKSMRYPKLEKKIKSFSLKQE